MIDTHCHLTFPHYQGRVAEVLQRARRRGVVGAITVSTTTANAIESRDLAHRFDNVWATAGVHPLHADDPIDWEQMLTAALDPRCAAFGELGLDRHYASPIFDVQHRVLLEQLEVIRSSGLALPVIVHCREAFDDLLPILRESGLPLDRFVFHCFTGNEAEARRVLDLGCWISFTGIVTFRNAADIQAAARIVPDDRIMAETDSPFLTPEPHRKIHPNEPQYAMDTALFLAQLRHMKWEEFHSLINDNTHRFFGIPRDLC